MLSNNIKLDYLKNLNKLNVTMIIASEVKKKKHFPPKERVQVEKVASWILNYLQWCPIHHPIPK